MAQQQDAALELILVRYYQRHAHALPSAETARIALRYWSDHFAGKLVSEATKAEQLAFVESMRNAGRSDGYIRRIMGVGKSALNWAYAEGEIAAVPFVVLPEDGPPRDRVLTLAESAALWAAATKPHERMFLSLAYGTLARPEAILGLHKGFVDFDRWLLAQNPPGRRQTRKYRPVVPVATFLRPWLTEAAEGPLVAWKGKPVASIKTAWRRMRADAGLEAAVVPKTIRHTMATELRAAGVPEAEIQGFLGHKAFGGKTEVYAKYRPDYLGSAVPVIDGYMVRLRSTCVAA
jgi:integrase